MTPPKRNPVYDLLSFLVGEKYKEQINKPTLVAPEPLAKLTGEPSKAITQFGEKLSKLEQEPGLLSERSSRRGSADSVISLVSERSFPTVEAPAVEPVKVRTNEEFLEGVKRANVRLAASRIAKGTPAIATQNILEKIKEERAAEEGEVKVDF